MNSLIAYIKLKSKLSELHLIFSFLNHYNLQKKPDAICTADEVIATQRRCYEIQMPVLKLNSKIVAVFFSL